MSINSQELLNDLKKQYLNSLKSIFNQTDSKQEPLKEYFQYLSNSIDAEERNKEEKRKLNRLKTNEKQLEYHNKHFKTNWNLDYCQYCKLDYWPFNCQVYMLPKCRITHRNSKIYMKYKLFNYKPKYKSYKDKLLQKILNKGIKLIYKCKRCLNNNLILNETKRDMSSFKIIKLNKNDLNKNLKEKARSSKTIHSVSFNKVLNNAEVSNLQKKNVFSGKKKFQSLHLKLKQNEMEQETIKNQKNRSLTDFLLQF
jgi:hypothetical protein